MATKKKAAKKTGWQAVRPRMDFRFKSKDHQKLVKQAAELDGRSMNEWIAIVTLRAAEQAIASQKS